MNIKLSVTPRQRNIGRWTVVTTTFLSSEHIQYSVEKQACICVDAGLGKCDANSFYFLKIYQSTTTLHRLGLTNNIYSRRPREGDNRILRISRWNLS